jgi:FkbM family methyltransferase
LLKNAFKSVLRSSGYAIKKVAIDNVDENLRVLLEVLDINCVLDVGAHYGEYAQSLRNIGYKNKIISFEPVKANFEILSKRAEADSNWIVYNYALGSANSTSAINVSNDTVFTSFLNPNEYSNEQFGAKADIARKELVDIHTLDSIFHKCIEGFNDPKVFLKLDTQGYDLEVVSGATRSLEKILGIQSEVSVMPIYQVMPDWLDALALYRSLGYEVTGMYPVSRDNKKIVVEFDCILRKII